MPPRQFDSAASRLCGGYIVCQALATDGCLNSVHSMRIDSRTVGLCSFISFLYSLFKSCVSGSWIFVSPLRFLSDFSVSACQIPLEGLTDLTCLLKSALSIRLQHRVSVRRAVVDGLYLLRYWRSERSEKRSRLPTLVCGIVSILL